MRYIGEAAAAARELDDTRFVAIDRHSRIGEPVTSSAYRDLDVLGVNEYFGWYRSIIPGLPQKAALLTDLGPYLDELHRRNPGLPLMITEFGAEAARAGLVTQRGSYEFQSKYAADHLAVHASKPYLNGSIYWALRDFRVTPKWQGGAPAAWSTPPWHNKSPDRGVRRAEAALLRAAPALPQGQAAALMRLLACLLVGAAALAACGSDDAGSYEDADKRVLALECITEEKDRQAALEGEDEILVDDGTEELRIQFFLTADEALGAQFQGEGEGAEQIGNALLFVRPELSEQSEELLADVEGCLGDL